MIALVPVRDGVLPSGAHECIAECHGRVLLMGSGTDAGAASLAGLVTQGWRAEVGTWAPAAWTAMVTPWLNTEPVVVLPGSPDGRDLAPRLAHALGRTLFAGAIEIRSNRVTVSRWGGQVLEDLTPGGAYVATLQPGVRGDVQPDTTTDTVWQVLDLAAPTTDVADAQVVEVQPPDATTMDLSEAPHIWAGGAGLDSATRFDQLTQVGARLGASVGATRVITDRGWIGHERQIGTTGVVVHPRWYVALGISGAVQHTSGLGDPDHIISVNTDAHCPMMQLADLAIVADANAVLDALIELTDHV